MWHLAQRAAYAPVEEAEVAHVAAAGPGGHAAAAAGLDAQPAADGHAVVGRKRQAQERERADHAQPNGLVALRPCPLAGCMAGSAHGQLRASCVTCAVHMA